MSQERLVFPIVIQGYGEIKGMNGWQVFVKHYRKLVETNDYRGRLIGALEDFFNSPEDKEKWIEHIKPEHYKMVGEEVAR